MTREEAKEAYNEDPQEDCMGLIDTVYDDFKSRICENCKYNTGKHKESAYCTNEDSYACYNEYYLEPSFGCNVFKRKNNQIGK